MRYKTIGFRMEAKPEQDSADLYIFDEIGEREDWFGTTHGFGPKGLMEQLDQIEQSEISVHINSKGGDAYDGIAVMNLLKNSGKKVTTIIEGIAASAASLIAMAGQKVIMRPSSQLMIHNCWAFTMGNAVELRKTADDMEKLDQGMRNVFIERSGGKLSAAKADELFAAESYLNADESMAYGLCDEITGKEQSDDPVPAEASIRPEIKAEIPSAPEDKADEDTSEENGEQAETDSELPFWFF